MNPYVSIPMIRPKRSVQNLTEKLSTTANIGEMFVSYAREMVPGDTFNLAQVSSVELSPTVAPFKGDLYMESVAFFVDYDQLEMEGDGGKFSDILMTTINPQEALPVPKWHFDDVKEDTKRGSLWDYCGFPTDLKNKPDDRIMPLAYLQRAYNHIYNEYIRDETIDELVDLNSNKIQTVCYKKDIFTSASLKPQKSDRPPYLPLEGTASARWTEEIIGQIVGYISTLQDITASGSNPHSARAGSNLSVTPNSNSTVSPVLETPQGSILGASNSSNFGIKIDPKLLDLLNSNVLDMSEIITFNIEDLRLLNRLQKWLERNALTGTRKKEYLISNYGIAPSDDTLDRPAFIGRIRTPVTVSSVLQTSASTDGGTAQGTKSGNASGLNAGSFGKWLAKEFGILMVVSWLRPKASYSQGIDRQWIKDTVYDFFNPIFEGLGMQEIFKGEVYIDGSGTDLETLGYTDRYNDMRTGKDKITGWLRAERTPDEKSLEVWAVQRRFDSHPSLTPEFLHVSPDDFNYLFAFNHSEHPEMPQAVVQCQNLVKAVRPIHKYNYTSL